jgi:hypothetical protein
MLQGWENFFIVSGTAAATLVGLLFVVVTLGTRLASSQAARGVHVFVTSTLVHFSGVLLVALTVLAPWPVAGLLGLAGLGYVMIVVRRMRQIDFIDLD